MLDAREAQSPGRRQVMFRALTTVRPSHLADPRLFDFAALVPGGGVTGPHAENPPHSGADG